jgi:hypothetical protein
VLSAALIPLAASARMGRGGGPDPDRAVAHLTDRLELTEEQQGEVRAILEEGAAEREALREAARTQMETHRDEVHARLAQVLSEDQVKELDQMRETRREYRDDCRGERRGDCQGERRGDCSGEPKGGRHGDCGGRWDR